MEYSHHGLTDACSKILTQAGVQQQGLAALSQAFKQAATIREVRSRRQALLKVFKRILTEAKSQHEKNDKSGGAEQPKQEKWQKMQWQRETQTGILNMKTLLFAGFHRNA